MTEIMLGNANPSWPVYRLGQLFRERREKVNDRDFPPLSVTKYGIVPQLETAAKSDDSENRKGVRAGDFVINSRSDRKGSGGLSALDGSVSLINIVLEPLGIHPRFAHHLLRSAAFQEEFYRWGHGIVADLWTTRFSDMKSIRLAVPDRENQRAIADFLDRETARIDHLIEKKQKLVKVLRERWRATLAKIIGEFPSARSLRLKQLIKYGTSISYGIVQPGESVADGVPFIQTANLAQGKLSIADLPRTAREIEAQYPRSRLEPGDVLLGIRASIGQTAVVSHELRGVNLSRGIARICPSQLVHPSFLSLVLESEPTQRFWSVVQQGTTFREVSIASVRELPVLVPSLAEQKLAVHNAGRMRRSIDLLAEKVLTSITLLQDYRAGLIAAAATGQIDLADWTKRGQVERPFDEVETWPLREEARA